MEQTLDVDRYMWVALRNNYSGSNLHLGETQNKSHCRLKLSSPLPCAMGEFIL